MMKKIFLLITMLITSLFTTSCTNHNVTNENDIIYITEDSFVDKFVEIYMNPENFIGNTIRFEGLFQEMHFAHEHVNMERLLQRTQNINEDDIEYTTFMVIRETGEIGGSLFDVDDHGVAGTLGLFIQTDNTERIRNRTWVEVAGTLEWFEIRNTRLLRLNDISIVQLQERGLEVLPSEPPELSLFRELLEH